MLGTTLRRLLLTTILVAMSLALLAGPATANPSADEDAAKFEVKFMTGMIDHHAGAIMMAEMCLQKAIHEELRAMCEGIITTQRQEITTMQAWLQSWYGITYQPTTMANMDKLASSTGSAFEVAFLEEMTKHHTGAIKEAKKALEKASHPELLAMAQSISTTQSAEIQMTQGWLCDWYGSRKN